MIKNSFLQFGKVVINPLAIASVADSDEGIVITLLSITSVTRGSEMIGYTSTPVSETIELVGDEAQAARAYFFAAMNTKKIA